MTHIIVAPRFRGPPESANGGYVAGLLALHVPSRTARVRLIRPPPLGTPLEIVASGESGRAARLELIDTRQTEPVTVAWAEPAAVDVRTPAIIDYETALQASRHFPGHLAHPFPGCFVCGTQRARGDWLRIFAGPLNEMRAAAPWIPDASLDDGHGKVRTEFMWAALDCPGYFAVERGGRAMLLGEIAARIDRHVHVDEACTILAWRMSVTGRRHEVGSAIFDDDGELAAVAQALWIEPKVAS
jgi:hypothetical protein